MSKVDVRGEVNVQTLSVSTGHEPTGAAIQALRIGGRPVLESAIPGVTGAGDDAFRPRPAIVARRSGPTARSAWRGEGRSRAVS